MPDVYKRPRDPRFPVVGLDEKPVQLPADVREPLAAEPGGVVRRRDHEYERNGTANVFCASEPLGNWRRLAVTDRRTRVDWAHVVRDLVDAPQWVGLVTMWVATLEVETLQRVRLVGRAHRFVATVATAT